MPDPDGVPPLQHTTGTTTPGNPTEPAKRRSRIYPTPVAAGGPSPSPTGTDRGDPASLGGLETPTPPQEMLEGITVLDLTQYLAGPAVTRLMVEMGAEVIKVEQPPYGDPMRSQGPRRNRRSGFFVQQNRGKKSLCVDIRRPEGANLIRRLASHVDVVVENFTPGVLEGKGLDYATLSADNPGLIMASVSGFGQTGPGSDLRCFDFIAQGYAGLMDLTGEPDGPPLFVGTGLADTNAGVHAFAAIGYALFNRTRTGRGTHIDVSMVDALFHVHETAVQAPAVSDGEYRPRRQGRHYQPVSPAGSFHGPEGWIVLLCTVNQINSLWDALGRPELADDPRFDTNDGRIRHRDELTAIIEEWLARFDTDAEAIAALQEAGVPCGPVLNPADAIDDPMFVERGTVRMIDDPFIGEFPVPGFPIRFDDTLPQGDLVAPLLGEHNREILTGLLGLDGDEVADLEARGLLGSKDR